MAKAAPVVYLLHGEDSYGMSQFIKTMEEKLGDPSTAEMNVTRLDGGGFDMEQLQSAASALPFLASRRMVILENASKKFMTQDAKEKFIKLLEDLPPTTAMVLVEPSPLDDKSWLLKWAKKAGERAYIRSYMVPKGKEMAKWIQDYAKEHGGALDFQAASLLGELVGEEPRVVAQEVEKLLAYVNYERLVEVDDVDHLVASFGGQGDFFVLIDSIAAGNGRKAMNMLQRLLEEQPPIMLFFSLVGHFRLLLQAREVIENGGNEGKVAEVLNIHPYRAKKLTAQARNMTIHTLELIYRRLLDYDLQIKTGQIEADLALETLIVGLTAEPG
jgi:DNA polymerase-3 subunit delta